MQSIITYSIPSADENSVTYLQSAYLTGNDETVLNELWVKVKRDDLASFETLHCALYPLLFNYANFILRDACVADAIIADVFIDFWYAKNNLASSGIKTVFVKKLRREVLAHLGKPATDRPKTPAVKLLTVLNNSTFKKTEAAFLSCYLQLNEAAVTEIIHN